MNQRECLCSPLSAVDDWNGLGLLWTLASLVSLTARPRYKAYDYLLVLAVWCWPAAAAGAVENAQKPSRGKFKGCVPPSYCGCAQAHTPPLYQYPYAAWHLLARLVKEGVSFPTDPANPCCSNSLGTDSCTSAQ